MLAVRANERSAAGIGVNVIRVKIASFAIASFIAGLGGCLLAYRQGVVTFDSFTALGGLALLSTAYLAGITSVWGGDPRRHPGVEPASCSSPLDRGSTSATGSRSSPASA